MPERSSKSQPRGLDQPSAALVGETTDENDALCLLAEAPAKNPAAVELGRRGGLKGGRARALTLSAEQRSQIARKAAWARWHGADEAEEGR